jgi:hypothetical protein
LFRWSGKVVEGFLAVTGYSNSAAYFGELEEGYFLPDATVEVILSDNPL